MGISYMRYRLVVCVSLLLFALFTADISLLVWYSLDTLG